MYANSFIINASPEIPCAHQRDWQYSGLHSISISHEIHKAELFFKLYFLKMAPPLQVVSAFCLLSHLPPMNHFQSLSVNYVDTPDLEWYTHHYTYIIANRRF